MKYPSLFSSGRIGTMHLPNRIVMGSMHLGYEGTDGSSERLSEFYAARARGGAALIITGGCAVNAEAIGGGNFSCIYRDEDLVTLTHITQRVHKEGGRIGLQLFHAGRYAAKQWLSGLQPVAPSAIRSTLHPSTPREMNEEDIRRTIHDFAIAALRAREAGFDCVEIMGSEGYLINQFFSPLTNRRTDNWGGSVENRVRFGMEIMREVRRMCGPDFPVIYRMSGIDLMPGSSSWEETVYFARCAEGAGADALNMGIGWHESRIPTISLLVPRAFFAFVSERIKPQVGIPCICSNRINDPDVAEEILAAGKCDFVSMARALLADPEFPRKASSGHENEIQTCIGCNQACLDNAFRNEPTTCILNPEAGRETEMRLRPAEVHKRIAVIGAGPAGLEASKVLAQRGHAVTLFEKQSQIGGQLLHAVRVPGKQEFLNTIRYYRTQLNVLNVRVELNTSPDISDLQKFDAVIVATGARPKRPSIPGADLSLCISYEDFFNTSEWNSREAIILGAGGIGCDVAHTIVDGFYPPADFFNDTNNVENYESFLRSQPASGSVTLTRRGKRIGERLGPTTRWAFIQMLECRGVRMLTQMQYSEITPGGLAGTLRTGNEIFIPADTIILAAGQEPDQSLFQLIHPHVENCFLIGAARVASEANAQTAIWEAADVARKL